MQETSGRKNNTMSNRLVVLTILVAVLTTFLMGRFVNHVFVDQQKHEDNAIKLEVQELNIRLKKVDERLNHQIDDLYKKMGELNQKVHQQAKP